MTEKHYRIGRKFEERTKIVEWMKNNRDSFGRIPDAKIAGRATEDLGFTVTESHLKRLKKAAGITSPTKHGNRVEQRNLIADVVDMSTILMYLVNLSVDDPKYRKSFLEKLSWIIGD